MAEFLENQQQMAEGGDEREVHDQQQDQRSLHPLAHLLNVPLVDNNNNNNGEGYKLHDIFTTNQIIGLYFSAHWCPPCRRLTPILAQRYNELQQKAFPFEIIFISSDPTETEALEYFHTMPWKMLQFNEEISTQLKSMYQISGIPTLVFLDESGHLITKDGRAIVFTDEEKWKTYESDKREADRILNEKILALPETITHASHPHPLVKTKDPYGSNRNYGCDICSLSGRSWSYHCASCQYDAHPTCVCDLSSSTSP